MGKLNDPPTPRRTPAVTPSPALSLLAPFVKEPTCPKCADTVIKLRHCTVGVNVVAAEYLRCECDRCGYVWRMACYVASPVTDSAPAGQTADAQMKALIDQVK